MTNEQLVELIQQGHKEYYTPLWEQNKRLIYILMRRCATAFKVINYADIEDFIQCGYFALVYAVRAYNADKGYKFTSYLNFQTKKAFCEAFGIKRNNIRIQEYSYNEPVESEDGTDEYIDFMADEKAKDLHKGIELAELNKTVREAVAQLPENECTVITRHYLNGEAYSSIANDLCIDVAQVKRYSHNGISMLQRNKEIINLYRLCTTYN